MKRALKNKELKNVATIMSVDPLDTKIAILSVSIVEKWATLLEIVDSRGEQLKETRWHSQTKKVIVKKHGMLKRYFP
jgi:hypothetical protein